MRQTVITLTTDFGVQSQGIGNMEGVIAQIAPHARVIHLAHGLPDFNIKSASRIMEATYYMPIGFHVCVVDPGVGTKRHPVIIKTKRGDYFIGPDNGVFLSAANILGGIEKSVVITNQKYMILPISPIFHGRHIFASAAAHLANGVAIEEFGDEISPNKLVSSPYQEARIEKDVLYAEVIWINKFGSLNLNILHKTWDTFGVQLNQIVNTTIGTHSISMKCVETFGKVAKGDPLILKDDYGRIEIAINVGNFAKKFPVQVGDPVLIKKTQ